MLKIIKEQIGSKLKINFVLIQDGVIGSTKTEKLPELLKELFKFPIQIYAIRPDIKARGMDSNNLNDKIKGLEYDDLVDLLINVTKIVSWM
jgi:sulfur relay protein TusB/DsrH